MDESGVACRSLFDSQDWEKIAGHDAIAKADRA